VPTPPTSFAISEARRIARSAGASVFAVAATAPLTAEGLAALAHPLAVAGADKLLLCESDAFASPADDGIHGRALDAAVARVPPMLVLFPAGGAGPVLGPSLAARVSGPFAPWCDLVVSDSAHPAWDGRSRVQVVRLRRDGRSQRRLDPAAIERPIVATVRAGRAPAFHGQEGNLEIEVLAVPARASNAVPVVITEAPNPFAPLLQAAVLILIGECDTAQAEALLAARDRLGPDSAVARADDVPAGVLAECCPEILVRVGHSSAITARAPRTRVVLAASLAPDEVPPDDVDLIWPMSTAAELTSLLHGLGATP